MNERVFNHEDTKVHKEQQQEIYKTLGLSLLVKITELEFMIARYTNQQNKIVERSCTEASFSYRRRNEDEVKLRIKNLKASIGNWEGKPKAPQWFADKVLATQR